MTRGKAAWALGAPLAGFVLWHASYRRASSYLLDGVIASPRHVLAVHALALAVGAVLAWRSRAVPPWRAPRLLVVASLAAGFPPLVAPIAFDDARAIVGLLFVTAAVLGVALGAFAATLVRTLPRLAFERETVLDSLRVGSLAPALVIAAVGFVIGERIGPARTSAALAVLAAVLAHLGAVVLAPGTRSTRRTARFAAGTAIALAALAMLLEPLLPALEAMRYGDPIVYAFGGVHGRAVLTSGRGAFQLYQGTALRLSTIDAHRRREAISQPALAAASRRASVLIVGGGDGAALREVLRYEDVLRVTLVDGDDALLHAGMHQPIVVRENAGAFADRRVTAVRADPLPWLRERDERFDLVLVDAGEPDVPARSKLYTTYFFRLVRAHLAEGGVGAISGPSPTTLRRGFASIVRSLGAADLHPLAYHANLPTMGVMGFVLIADHALQAPRHVPIACAWMDDDVLAESFLLARDEVATDEVEENLLWRQVLLRYRDD